MSATFAPRKSGWTARPPRSAILLRAFAALEAHRAGALAVDLDEEDAERLRVGVRAGDLLEDLVAALRAHGSEEGLDVLVPDEVDEEVGVVGARASDGDGHAGSSCARTPNSL